MKGVYLQAAVIRCLLDASWSVFRPGYVSDRKVSGEVVVKLVNNSKYPSKLVWTSFLVVSHRTRLMCSLVIVDTMESASSLGF